jgi:hypothetical protein
VLAPAAPTGHALVATHRSHQVKRAARLVDPVPQLTGIDQNRGEHDRIQRTAAHVVIGAGIERTLNVRVGEFVVGKLDLGCSQQSMPRPVEREKWPGLGLLVLFAATGTAGPVQRRSRHAYAVDPLL